MKSSFSWQPSAPAAAAWNRLPCRERGGLAAAPGERREPLSITTSPRYCKAQGWQLAAGERTEGPCHSYQRGWRLLTCCVLSWQEQCLWPRREPLAPRDSAWSWEGQELFLGVFLLPVHPNCSTVAPRAHTLAVLPPPTPLGTPCALILQGHIPPSFLSIASAPPFPGSACLCASPCPIVPEPGVSQSRMGWFLTFLHPAGLV